MKENKKLRIGTRGSALALAQAKIVAELLERSEAGLETEIAVIKTTGDRAREKPARHIDTTGIFTKEIESALLRGEIDLAVHSMKDLPTSLHEDLCIGAVPERIDPLDALVSRNGETLEDLKSGARVGTGSPRRRAQILSQRPDLNVVPLSGNVETRLRAVRRGRVVDCAVLAMAGLMRLGRAGEASQPLTADVMLPAPGQGALAVQARRGDETILEIVQALNHTDSFNEVLAERALTRELGAGCRTPLGALAWVRAGTLLLKAVVLGVDGRRTCRVEHSGNPGDAAETGKRAAAILLERGAGELMGTARD